MWDPGTYLRYADERARPYVELLARIGADAPRTVVDLGCGPGTLTALLAQRWPRATVLGIDSSPDMIADARSNAPRIEFAVGDIGDWLPDAGVDVVISNATLQWLPHHTELLSRWVRALAPGSWLAIQVPGNFDLASHRALRDVARGVPWRERLAHLVRDPSAVLDPAGYVALLSPLGCAVDAWETTYVHMLDRRAGRHPVLRWMEGTALRPIRATLADAEWDAFCAELEVRLAIAYPALGESVPFAFRRVFCVARTAQ